MWICISCLALYVLSISSYSYFTNGIRTKNRSLLPPSLPSFLQYSLILRLLPTRRSITQSLPPTLITRLGPPTLYSSARGNYVYAIMYIKGNSCSVWKYGIPPMTVLGLPGYNRGAHLLAAKYSLCGAVVVHAGKIVILYAIVDQREPL